MKIYKERNGNISTENGYVPMIEGNRHYDAILAEVNAGNAEIIPWEGSPEQVAEDLSNYVRKLESVVEAHIQEPITAYNEAHELAFGGVHNCANYLNSPLYSHYDFCRDIWDFNVSVWETARDIQTQVQEGLLAMPDVIFFKSMLPTYAGAI